MINHPNRKKRPVASATVTKRRPRRVHDQHEHDYSALLTGVRLSFAIAGRHVFRTDASGLNDLYLDSLPSDRQLHNCSACRRFIETYGGLVAIDDEGGMTPVMWNPNTVPEFYQPAFAALSARIRRARVTSVFLTKSAIWGTPMTGEWSHISVPAPHAMIYRERALTAGQAMAAAKENFRTVATALTEFTPAMLDEALRLLRADSLARSERFIEPVAWLRGLQDRPKGKRGENILWKAIAAAPEGYCHPKSSVIGPLLDDIASGMPFADIKARFDAKMHPLLYQRPQAAPSVGNIKAAEAIVAKMGIERSLERRYARIDDLRPMWTPTREPAPAGVSGGVFGHLKARQSDEVRPVDIPAVTMTWDKFSRTVLPAAKRLQILVPNRGRFVAMTAGVHHDAPPILKWDRDDERNTVAWYCYNNGSTADQWRLSGGTWADITAVTPFPNLWGSKPMPFLTDGVVLVISGAADTQTGMGNALFPEVLRDDLRAVRSTIEAYSRSAALAGRDEASACGYDIRKNAADCALRVLTAGSYQGYRIDRWD